MGLYATTTALQTMMVGVTFNTATSALASALIDRAERRVNSVLALRYNLSSAYFQTTTSIPPQVREWSAQLAEGWMWQANSRGGAGKESMARGKELINQVLADLKAIQEYKMELTDTAGSLILDATDTSYRVLCNTSDYTPTFDEGDELSWQVDKDKLDDISNTKD